MLCRKNSLQVEYAHRQLARCHLLCKNHKLGLVGVAGPQLTACAVLQRRQHTVPVRLYWHGSSMSDLNQQPLKAPSGKPSCSHCSEAPLQDMCQPLFLFQGLSQSNTPAGLLSSMGSGSLPQGLMPQALSQTLRQASAGSAQRQSSLGPPQGSLGSTTAGRQGSLGLPQTMGQGNGGLAYEPTQQDLQVWLNRLLQDPPVLRCSSCFQSIAKETKWCCLCLLSNERRDKGIKGADRGVVAAGLAKTAAQVTLP